MFPKIAAVLNALAAACGAWLIFAQVTDAWLAELSRRKDAKLAKTVEALAKLHADVVFLLPG